MLITQHGRTEKFYRGVAVHQGTKLAFFGYSPAQVLHKERAWVKANPNTPAIPNTAPPGRPALRLIQGGAA